MKFRIIYNPGGCRQSAVYFSVVRDYVDRDDAYETEVTNNREQVAHPEQIQIDAV